MNSIKHNEITFQLMIEASPNALLLVNEKGKIAYVNKFTEELFLYKKLELIGQDLTVIIPNRFKQKHPDLLKSFFLNPSSRQLGANRDLFAIKKDATEFPVEIGLNPIVTVDGALVLAAIIDITERKNRELELEDYRKKLEESNKKLNMFASITAHDMKSPIMELNSLIHLIEIALNDNDIDKVNSYIKILKDTNTQFSEMIDGILAYSKDSFITMKLDKIDLNMFIKKIVSKYKSDKKIVFVLGESFPVIQHYVIALTQIFNNLIDNAIKYNDKEICKINIDCIEKDDVFELFIADNGPGIAEFNRKKIFDLFENLRNKKPNSTGIGLATVKKLITEANGEIRVESSEQEGSKFIFTIQK